MLTARRLAVVTLVLGMSACDQNPKETSLSSPPSPVDSSAPTTATAAVDATDPTSVSSTSTVGPTTSAASPSSPAGSVSYLSRPPTLPLRRLATVPFTPCCGVPAADVAVGDQGVVVNQSWLGRMTTIGFDGVTNDVPVDGEMYSITYGPGDVVYGLRQGDSIDAFAVVAIALRGDQRGTTVSSAPLGMVAYMELPDAAFGHGATGIIDRTRAVNSTVIGYVDSAGQPLSWAETPVLYTATRAANSVVVSAPGLTWRLEIEAAPDAAGTFNGPSPPAPSSDDLAVMWTYIGPNARPDDTDFGEPTMPVLAEMHPDGSVQWWSIPVGWNVVASDVWGTVLAHIAGDSIDLALAELN